MEFLIYDGIVVAILVLFVWLGWRKGLILSLCGLAAAVVAFLGAGFVADTFDQPVATAMTPRLESMLEERISQHDDDLGVSNMAELLRQEGGLYSWAADIVEDALDEEQLVHDVTRVVTTATQAVAQRIAHSLIFAMSFLVLYVLLVLLLHALNLVAKLPVLHFCNGLGGGVIGFVKGAVVVFVAVGAASLLLSAYLPDAQTMERSYIFKFFVKNNIILSLFGG